MRTITAAAFAAVLMTSVSAAPARADGVPFVVTMPFGSAIGLIINSRVVARCKKRELTSEEALKTAAFPILSVLRSLRDCRSK